MLESVVETWLCTRTPPVFAGAREWDSPPAAVHIARERVHIPVCASVDAAAPVRMGSAS